jgi:acetyl esterase
MPLNPQVEALLGMFAQMPQIDYASVSAAEMRAINDQPMPAGDLIAMARVEDLSLQLPGHTLAARLYVPEGTSSPAPLTLYFHGGGWVVGTLETHDGTARALARASGSALLSVGYRLAPESPYPAPIDDCYAALEWAAENATMLGCDPARLAVAGDSAGGNLAAAVAIMARDRSGPALRHQLLIYPVADDDFSKASYAENGSGDYFLSTEAMRWFWKQYLGANSEAPLARIAGTADLTRLPSATVLVAEYDPLRDEGQAYGGRLAAAGIDTATWLAPGMIHGFVSMFGFVPDALPWIDRVGARLREALA